MMFRLLVLLAGLGGLVLLAAWWLRRQPAAPAATTNPLYATMLRGLLQQAVPFVSVAQLRARPAAVLLDTRTPEEFAVSHLPGAHWVGYQEFSLARLPALPPDTPIVVYCSVGLRSERIGTQLRQAGYTQVHNLYGGIFEWVNEGQTVLGPDGRPTPRVHAYSPSWGIWLQRGQKVYRTEARP